MFRPLSNKIKLQGHRKVAFFILLLFSFIVSADSPRVVDLSLGKVDNCITLSNKEVKCWGDNPNRLIAFTKGVSYSNPTLIKEFEGLREIKFSEYYACGLTNSDQLKCWGDLAFRSYESGVSSFKSPTHFPTPSGVKDFALGYWHMCAVLEDGRVVCKGQSRNHELGFKENSVSMKSEEFVEVKLGSFMAESISAGSRHMCALDVNGSVYCWGRNTNGSTAPTTAPSILPTKIELGEEAVQVALGEYHSCAVLKSGKVKCWGENSNLGISNVPEVISGLKPQVKFLATSSDHACALMKDHEVFCWGRNAFGEAGGNAETKNVSTPVKIKVSQAEKLTVVDDLSCAHLKSGKIYCWGMGFSVIGTGRRNYEPYLFESSFFYK